MASASKRAGSGSSSENGPSSKKQKMEAEEEADSFSFSNSPIAFEEELAIWDSEPPPSSGFPGNRWTRPPPPSIDPAVDSITFQQIDIDHYLGDPIPGMPGAQTGPVPILRMFGVTMEGNSVCAHVHGFLPYFYVPAPSDAFRDEHCDDFRQMLNEAVLNDMRSNKDGVRHAVLAVEICRKCSMYGFYFNQKFPFLKITVSTPKLVAPARRVINFINVPPFGQVNYQPFESNIEIEVRFMVDTGVVGCNWIECPPGKFQLRNSNPPAAGGASISAKSGFSVIGGASERRPLSKCQIECDISWEEFISHPAEGEWQKIAPVRILSFDIECAGRKGVFPEAEKDPVIQIANMVVTQGEKDPFIRNVFTLKSCAPIVGSVVKCYGREADMLKVCIYKYTCI